MLVRLRRFVLASPARLFLGKVKHFILGSRTLQRIRAAGLLLLADILGAFNIPHNLEEPLARQWKRILRRSRLDLSPLTDPATPRVLIATSYGFSPFMVACETVLATALRLRGVQPYFLVCDHALPACEWNAWGNDHPDPGEFARPAGGPSQRMNCDQCTAGILNTLEHFRFPVVRFQDVLLADDLDRLTKVIDATSFEDFNALTYKGVAVGKQAYASTLRFLRRVNLESTPYHRWLYQRYLLGALMVVELGERVFEKVQPDYLFMTHGIYITHGSLLGLAQMRNLKSSVWGAYYRRNTMWISPDEALTFALAHEPEAVWRKHPLTSSQNELLTSYLNSKLTGAKDQKHYNTNPINVLDVIITTLELDVTRSIVSLFTNLLWDGELFYRSDVFKGQLDWIFETITHFISHPEAQLVIRIHPAESKRGTKQPLVDEIRACFPVLPSNIKIIPPESRISSYSLAEISQAALIFESTIGMELAARGIPVIMVANSFSRDKGFTYGASSREEYFLLLNQAINKQLQRGSSEMIECARKFAYHVFFRKSLDFQQVSAANPELSLGVRLNFRSTSELARNNNLHLDALIESILFSSALKENNGE